jgi:hypothetical protein
MEKEWKLKLLKRALQILEERDEAFICTAIYKAFSTEKDLSETPLPQEAEKAEKDLVIFIEEAIRPWTTLGGHIYSIFIRTMNVWEGDPVGWKNWIWLQRISWVKQMIKAVEEDRSLCPPHFTDLHLKPEVKD